MRRFLMASAIIRSDDRVLLVKNDWGQVGRIWSIPGGRLEEGEAATAAIRREVLEETGLTVATGDLAYVLDYHNTTMDFHFIYLVFPAVPVGGAARVPVADEHVVDVRWVPIADLDRYLLWPAYRTPVLAYLAGSHTRYYRNPDAGLKAALPDVP